MADDLRALLGAMNRSELVQLARSAGLGNVSRDRSVEELVDLVYGDEMTELDKLDMWRHKIEAHIKRFRNRLLSQLPGCDGRCTTYGCPDLIVTRCWEGFSRDML